jgi:DNA uptake protein ComE-like DNA-binding protein
MTAPSAQRGSVLVLTLWLAAGLSVGALLAGHVAVLRYRGHAYQGAVVRAEHATDAGMCYVEQLLTALVEAGQMPDPEDYAAADLWIGECRLWLLGRSADKDASEPVFALQDEAGKLNLNTATREMLEALPGMTPELAAAIIDWRDPDDEISADGAESETYLARDPPSMAKNAPFESVDEVRLLNGADARLLTGRDRNRNTLVEPWEEELAQSTQERFQEVPDLGLLDLFTVHSREPDTSATGQARTDLNGDARAVRQVLQELFGERGEAMAAAAGLGSARLGSVLEFCVRARATDTEATGLFDRFTVSTAQGAVVGRVNINTASVAVLACLPGVGEDGAERLSAYREQNTATLTTPIWLARALGDEAAIAAGPYVTSRTYQVAADLVAVAPFGHAFRRTRTVFDLTTGKPVVVSRRDLTHLGWPLGAGLHASLVTSGGAPR